MDFHNDDGFVLVAALLMLVVLTLIGIAATSTTNIELKIAGNDKTAGESFHKADGGLEASIEVLEQNIRCPTGFSLAPAGFDNADATTFFSISGVNVFDNNFALDETIDDVAGATGATTLGDVPSDAIRSLRLPLDPAVPSDADTHTNMAIWGETQYIAGSAIQMAAGYEGKGKGAASGGGAILYEVHSQHVGKNNSESIVALQWRHIISSLVGCKY
ncbi:pilus assembly PilX N-terminal domain-containing protein [Desulfogranum marinum]|uniref:pilus assembly PilX family protein n=1 Tax=Desulfogranum marinum TaxID=453220 RepID=UPI0029C72EF7|nr:pilus assembly PilX N-terminal domain-containing protein [Desulfogranum marinum]